MNSFDWGDSLNISKKISLKGRLLHTKSALVFFGNDCFTPSDLQGFSSFHLYQVHGNQIHRRQPGLVKGDGHWTDRKGEFLLIKTADCLPVFIANLRKVMGLHMGWRAFTNQILEKGLQHFPEPESTEIFIGPHIGYNSFQVDEKTASEILRAQGWGFPQALQAGLARRSHQQTNHWYINLSGLMQHRLKKKGYKRIVSVDLDTMTSPHHYSHRRNRWRRGINYSYIIKN